MEELAKKALRELSQMDDHEEDGEMHFYIDEYKGNLRAILRGIVILAQKGADQDAA